MKKILLSIFFLTLSSLLSAQNNLFILGEGGVIDGVKVESIDSIRFEIDDDGNMVQVLYSKDTSSKANIDEIADLQFHNSDIQVNKDVFALTAKHNNYIKDATSSSFTLLPQTPNALLPSKNAIVVAEYDCTAFEDGIVAKVVKIVTDENGYHYQCEPVSYNEVYDTLIYAGELEPESDEETRATVTHPFFNLTYPIITSASVNGANAQILGSSQLLGRLRLSALRTPTTPLTLGAYIEMEYNLNCETQLEVGSYSLPDIKLIDKLNGPRIRFPNPALGFIWIQPKVSLLFYNELKLGQEFEADIAYNRKDGIYFQLSNAGLKASIYHTQRGGISPKVFYNGGSIELGLRPELLFTINGINGGIGIYGQYGVKAEFDYIPEDFYNLPDDEAYESVKDCKATLSFAATAGGFAELALVGRNDKESVTFRTFEIPLWNGYYVPKFHNPKFELNNGMIKGSISTTRNTTMPYEIGIGMFNDNGDMVTSQFNDDYSSVLGNKTKSFEWEFDNTYFSKATKMKPLVRAFNRTLVASPEIPFELCPAIIKTVRPENAYHNDEDDSYNIVTEIHAQLNKADYPILEWGISNESHTQHFPLDKNKTFDTTSLIVSRKTDILKDNESIDFKSFKMKVYPGICAYVVRRNKNTAALDTLYSELDLTPVIYDKKPSIRFSNTRLIETITGEIVCPINGEIYEKLTKTEYQQVVKGAMWMRECVWIYNNGWSSIGNPYWNMNCLKDFSDTQIDSSYYHADLDEEISLSNLKHSEWVEFTCRGTNITGKSNCLNFYDDGYELIGAEVSEQPLFKNTKRKNEDKQNRASCVVDFNSELQNEYSNLPILY